MPPDGPPYRPAAPRIFDSPLSKEERMNRYIAKLDEESDKLYDILELARFRKDGANEYNQARKRYDEIAKEVEEWRAKAANEKKKKEEEKAAEERKRNEEVAKKKDEELKELQARYDAERKARIEAEKRAAAELKKYQERLQKAHDDHKERAKKANEEHQQKVKETDEQLKALHTEIAVTKKRADLLADYDRIRAVEQARNELEDAKKRLQREHEEFHRKSYEAFQAEQRKLRKATEEAERYAKQKAKEILDARKDTERRASWEPRKEVGFNFPRNQTHEHRSSSQYRQGQRPEQHHAQHAENYSSHNSRQASHEYSRSQHHRHSQEPAHRQDLEVNYQSSSQPYSWHHDKVNHRSTADASRDSHAAPVGLSGMPAGSVIDSYRPVVAPWEGQNQDWPTSQEPAWQRSLMTFEGLEAERNASSDLAPRSRSPGTVKEQWPLPPTPIPSPNVEAYTPQETEAERLRWKLAESEAKRAKMAAELERKQRVSGADSVATWQTGIKSIWEDPTKDTRKDNRDSGRQDHPAEASKTQAASSFSSRHNDRGGPSNEPLKPAISVQNLHRRQPSASHHHSLNSKPEARHQSSGGDHASVKTQYFEAEEYLTSNRNTPRPKPDTQYAWQKAPGERYPSYVPPTDHCQPSPPPVLPPTPPRGSQASTPAIVRPVPIRQAPARQETKTPALTGLPGSWRDEQLPAQDHRSEKHWPANVSTPSVPSPAVPATKPYEISQSSHYSHIPKYVPPPPSSHYSGANYHVRKPSFSYSVAPYYPSHPSTHGTVIPMPIAKPIAKPIAGVPSVPVYPPAYDPSYASYNGKADVGPSGHNGDGGKRSSSFPSWGDKTAAQSSGDVGVQQEARKKVEVDKGNERAWFSWGDMTAAQSLGDGGAEKVPRKEDKGKERAWF